MRPRLSPGPLGANEETTAHEHGNPHFAAQKGFHVEMAAKNPDPKDVFSLVNMTFDAKGRLLVSQEGGPILLCTDPDKDGVLQEVKDYCTQVKNCHGMCWVKDALYSSATGRGRRPVPLPRHQGDDEIDEATLLHSYATNRARRRHGRARAARRPPRARRLPLLRHRQPRVGEHGQAGRQLAAEALAARPDGARPGQARFDRGRAAAALNDANGHAANILAPGGTIWRMRPDGKNMSLVAGGFRNHFDAAFSPDGELFTFDSDMEWDEGLPWYRPVPHLPLPARRRLRAGAPAGQHARLLHRQPAAAIHDTAAARPSASSSTIITAFGRIPRRLPHGRLVARHHLRRASSNAAGPPTRPDLENSAPARR